MSRKKPAALHVPGSHGRSIERGVKAGRAGEDRARRVGASAMLKIVTKQARSGKKIAGSPEGEIG
jgi:hypothetical protein